MDTLLNSKFFSNSQIFTQLTNDGDDFIHKHKFYEFFYLLDGNIIHCIDGETTTLSAGDFCVVQPNKTHMFKRDNNNSSTHRDILISVELIQECSEFLKVDFIKIIDDIKKGYIKHLSVQDIDLLEKTMTLHTINRPIHNKTIQFYDKTICIEILKILFLNEEDNSRNSIPIWLNYLLSKMQTFNYCQKNINDILDEIHFNKTYMCRAFKKYMGINMSEYFLRNKLLYASILIRGTNFTITQISSEVGIQSTAYFNKQFKKLFNLTPSQYRNLQK